MTVSENDATDLAGFFLDLIPSKTAIALVSDNVEHPGPGELAFRNVLRKGGFEVCVFSELATAQVWLSLFVSSCDRKELTCGPDCEFALERTCPANDLS
ncbi:hypothetical protein [Maricaulis sp. MIT060901]|uniref:hypothetical protein n=1 Tax=Maricaulis sp. MIT060901 TaxID=3096993 RepID=UPI00399B5999